MEVLCELGTRKKVVKLKERDDVICICANAFGVRQSDYRFEMYREEWSEWVEVDGEVALSGKPKLRLVAHTSATRTESEPLEPTGGPNYESAIQDPLALAELDTLPAESEQR